MARRSVPPTRREWRQARARGQVAVSPVLVGAGALAGAACALWLSGPAAVGRMIELFRRSLSMAADTSLAARPGELLSAAGQDAVAAAGPVMAAALGGAALVGLAQTRGLFSLASARAGTEAPAPYGWDALALVRWLGLTCAGVAVAWWAWRASAPALLGLCGLPPGDALGGVSRAASSLGLAFLALLAVVGAADLLARRAALARALALTPAEARRRQRQERGDPAIRRARLRQHRSLGAAGGPAAVRRGAALLVTAGGALAVALAYRPGEMQAPRVLARGRGSAAGPLVQAARSAGVPIADQPALAAALWSTPEGAPIPRRHYAEVARLLTR